jgi:molybdate transport system substrate-binding protein
LLGVPAGQSVPPLQTAEQLAQALQQSAGIYMADPLKATAGIHFMKVLRELGLDQSLGSRLRPFADGQTAMAAMLADSPSASGPLIGCTQITEILNTPGIQLVGLLPKQFELATPYWAAVTRGSSQAQAAALMVELLSAPAQAELRKTCGFE